MLQCGFVRSNFAFAMMDNPRRQKPGHLGAGAGDGNRTHVASLEGWSSTIELHPPRERREPRHATPMVVEFSKASGPRVVEGEGFEPSKTEVGRFTVCCL